MRRYELTDEQYESIADLLPANGQRGGQWKDHRPVLNGIFWILHTGAQWRELPDRYGPWKTVYDRFNRWSSDGTIDAILHRLHVRLDEAGRIDWDLWCVDGSHVRASRSAAGGQKRPGPMSRMTTRWAAHAGGSDRSCTWSRTVQRCR